MTEKEDYEVASAEMISFDAIRSYVCTKSWENVSTSRQDVEVFAQFDDERIIESFQLPKSDTDRHVAFVLDAARAIARFERKRLDETLRFLSTLDYDVVKCRLISQDVKDGSVPLGEAVDFVAKACKLISVAVKDVVSPDDLYHQRIRSTEIDELSRRARFGQTDRGSFVINLYLPLGTSSDDELFVSVRRNVFRKSLIHLMETLDHATKLIDNRTPDLFLEENSNAEIKASANLFVATDEARVSDDSELEISVNWSPKLPIDSNVPSRILVSERHSTSFWEWNKVYQPKMKETTSSEFLAKVISVAVQDRDENKRPSGIAIFQIIGNDEIYEASSFLNSDDFNTANECLMNDHFVAFRGKCERSRKKATIVEISNFRTLFDSNNQSRVVN